MRVATIGFLAATTAIVFGCSTTPTYATDAQVFFAETIRINLDRIAYNCEWTDAADLMTKSLFKDADRIAAAHDGLEAALIDGTPWRVEQAWFYTIGGLDLINAYAAGDCPLAQTLIIHNVASYERLWDENYLAVSTIHDTVNTKPVRPLPSLPPPRLDPELLKPDPVITRLEEQVAELEQCASRHNNSDYASVAASLRGTLAISSKWPDEDEKGILTFQMENANVMLINCNR